MSSKLFDSVTFEASKLPTISAGTVANAMAPTALALGQADEWQAYLLYKGPCHAVASGSSLFFGQANASKTGSVFVMVPPFATHVQIGLVASGTGNVVFNSTYTVPVSSPYESGDPYGLEGAQINFGPSGDQALATGLSHTGAFIQQSYSFARDTDIRVSAVVFRFFRRSTSI
jgi:hypothetical protein